METPKVGRPPVGTKIAVRLPDDLIATIDELAAKTGTTRSAWIRDVVVDAVARKQEVGGAHG